jgi:hypothetical protein
MPRLLLLLREFSAQNLHFKLLFLKNSATFFFKSTPFEREQ